MIGKTRPHEAASGTIRGDLALAGLRNLVHASDAPETAASEIALYFQENELISYERELDRWMTLLTAVLGPLVILLVGAMVLFIVLAILLPIFNLNQMVK